MCFLSRFPIKVTILPDAFHHRPFYFHDPSNSWYPESLVSTRSLILPYPTTYSVKALYEKLYSFVKYNTKNVDQKVPLLILFQVGYLPRRGSLSLAILLIIKGLEISAIKKLYLEQKYQFRAYFSVTIVLKHDTIKLPITKFMAPKCQVSIPKKNCYRHAFRCHFSAFQTE